MFPCGKRRQATERTRKRGTKKNMFPTCREHVFIPSMRKHYVSWYVPNENRKVFIPGCDLRQYESETGFQIYCADWLRKQFELTKNDRFDNWHHSANERYGATAGLRAKLMGQATGFPDFIHCGLKLAIELKINDNELSIDQKKWLNHLKTVGWKSYCIRYFVDFQHAVLNA